MVLGNTLNILRPPDRSTPPIQTGWNEDLVKNMHKVLGELAQQITFQVFGGLPGGTSRPAAVKANGAWLDITSATAPIIKLFDGTDDITVMTFNFSTNTVSFPGVLTDLVGDTSPQLGGTLDLNGNVITGLEIGTDIQALDATLTSLAAVSGVAGDIFIATATDVWAKLAKGADGNVLQLESGLPAWGSSLVRHSPIATTSGTTHDFTVAAGANRISVILGAVSTNGEGELLIRLGDSGGVENTGYSSLVSERGNSDDDDTGFIISHQQLVGDTSSGIITLERINGNIWVSSGNLQRGAGAVEGVRVSAGIKTVSDELTTVQLTTTAGDTFDAGEVNIFVQ